MNILLLHKKIFLTGVLIISILKVSYAQYREFSLSDFMDIVKQHHPLTYQANLLAQRGKANLQLSRGNFDPKTYFTLNQKYFDGKQYYSYLHGGLKIPTWFGVALQGGYQNNNGVYLNSEAQLPNQGLWYFGLSANIGKGLFIDNRRAELKQAKIFLESSKLEQKLMLNYLYFEARKAYWRWWYAYNNMLVMENAVNNARLRLKNIRETAAIGEKPLIDTLKVFILLQNRQVKLQQAQVLYSNESRYLETFLWQDGFVPLVLDSLTVPQSHRNTSPVFPQMIQVPDTLIERHPDLQYVKNNLEITKIEYRLARENLKPELQVKYNLLSSAQTPPAEYQFNENDYKLGVKVSYPIFTRKERGKLNLTKIKLQEYSNKLHLKQAEIKYKMQATLNNWRGTYRQTLDYIDIVKNYKTLFNAEQKLFDIGESSMFMVNFREQQYIDAQLKLLQLMFKNRLSKIKFEYQGVIF